VHIQLGASKLALGLIVPLTVGLGMEVHLVGRPGRDSRAEFGVSFAGNGGLSFYEVASFKGPTTVTEMDASAREALLSPRPVLFTATLRGAIAERFQFTRELLQIRADREVETVFLACENSPAGLYERLRGEFEPRGVRFLPTMVNRICPAFIETHDPRRIVRAHPLGEWVIQGSADEGQILADLASAVDTVQLTEDLRPFELRKRWLVNGGQLQLAILAHSAKRRSLRAAANRPGLRDPVNHFHAEANRVLEAEFPELDGNLPYAISHVIAFCEITDSVKRVLDIRRADLAPFFRSFDARFGEPARRATAFADGRTPEVFLSCLAALDYLLEQRRAFNWQDADNPRHPARLSEAADDEAAEAYAAMLSGWVPENSIGPRRDRLGIVLAAQRDGRQPPARRIGLASGA
jgi:hypothetical protein